MNFVISGNSHCKSTKSFIIPPLNQLSRLFSTRVAYTHRSGKQVKARLAKMALKKAALGDDARMVLKTPKGTRDFGPRQMAIREKVLGIVVDTFKRHGAETIDTPVFELREVLMGKYGEEGGKLVFDLADQGGELYSLRYDLTVPFARYLAMHKLTNVKRYQIAKVYRRDQPVMTKGRYREFYQCDFDIAGQYDLMVPEAECLKIVDEVISALDIGDFEIRINHRILLEGMFSVSGIKAEDFKNVCSSIDKLDKQPWAEIRAELLNEKFIQPEAVDKLEGFVRLRESNPGLENTGLLEKFADVKDPQVQKSIEELKLLLEYAELFGCSPKHLVFEPSLARGLDYYTGAIYEVVMKEFSFEPPGSPTPLKSKPSLRPGASEEDPTPSSSSNTSSGPIGSVAAGGRYDKLVGMFSTHGGSKKKKDSDVPCVGVSFGIERLFSIMEMKLQSRSEIVGQPIRVSPTDVFVASAQKNLLKERMKLCAKLWAAGIRCELSYKANPKYLNQMQYCEEQNIPLVVTIGEDELKNNYVKVKNVSTRQETDVQLSDLVDSLQKRLILKAEEVGS